jgi:predicted hydrolase (HD superfamily)
MMMNKEKAERLLLEMTKSESLLRHAKSVALVMEAYAKRYNESTEEWYVTGLLHDADYDQWPEEHPNKIVQLLNEEGEHKIAHAISAHYSKWEVPYETLLDKALIACDEITGFIIACCQVRPDGVESLEVKSVKKKFKTKTFAATAERSEVEFGRQLLEVELDQHIAFIIEVLKSNRDTLKI